MASQPRSTAPPLPSYNAPSPPTSNAQPWTSTNPFGAENGSSQGFESSPSSARTQQGLPALPPRAISPTPTASTNGAPQLPVRSSQGPPRLPPRSTETPPLLPPSTPSNAPVSSQGPPSIPSRSQAPVASPQTSSAAPPPLPNRNRSQSALPTPSSAPTNGTYPNSSASPRLAPYSGNASQMPALPPRQSTSSPSSASSSTTPSNTAPPQLPPSSAAPLSARGSSQRLSVPPGSMQPPQHQNIAGGPSGPSPSSTGTSPRLPSSNPIANSNSIANSSPRLPSPNPSPRMPPSGGPSPRSSMALPTPPGAPSSASYATSAPQQTPSASGGPPSLPSRGSRASVSLPPQQAPQQPQQQYQQQYQQPSQPQSQQTQQSLPPPQQPLAQQSRPLPSLSPSLAPSPRGAPSSSAASPPLPHRGSQPPLPSRNVQQEAPLSHPISSGPPKLPPTPAQAPYQSQQPSQPHPVQQGAYAPPVPSRGSAPQLPSSNAPPALPSHNASASHAPFNSIPIPSHIVQNAKAPPPSSAMSEVEQYEREVLELTNAERAQHGLSPLKWDDQLAFVAKEKSKDMAYHKEMSHDSPILGGFAGLFKRFNVPHIAGSENIAAGQDFPELVVYGWMNSPPHRKNILTPNWTHLGVGYDPNGHYWTQEFSQKPPGADEVNIEEWEQRVLVLTNEERFKNGGLSPLKWDNTLGKMARAKADDMCLHKILSHDSPVYGSMQDLFKHFRVLYRAGAENCAMGQTSPEQVVEGWMNSPGHRKNILTPNFTHLGVGVALDGFWWTQEFSQK